MPIRPHCNSVSRCDGSSRNRTLRVSRRWRALVTPQRNAGEDSEDYSRGAEPVKKTTKEEDDFDREVRSDSPQSHSCPPDPLLQVSRNSLNAP
eukprot:1404822-Amphidinium_carterae.1